MEAILFVGASFSYFCLICLNMLPNAFPDSRSSLWQKRESSDKGGLSANATAYAPSRVSSKGQGKTRSSNELSEGGGPSKAQGTAQYASSHVRPSSSASSTSECGGGASASGGPGLSPSSSVGSLSSEKSTLNPHAKVGMLYPSVFFLLFR